MFFFALCSWYKYIAFEELLLLAETTYKDTFAVYLFLFSLLM